MRNSKQSDAVFLLSDLAPWLGSQQIWVLVPGLAQTMTDSIHMMLHSVQGIFTDSISLNQFSDLQQAALRGLLSGRRWGGEEWVSRPIFSPRDHSFHLQP